MRVLIVEDEPLIAADIELVLAEDGHVIVATAATVEHALALAARETVDAVVLDANLAGKSAEPVAQFLIERKVPFVGISGYSHDQRPHSFASAPFLSKPFRPSLLISALSDLVAAR